MNERILELANIWANRRAEDEKLGIVYTFSEPALEQFAELIVRECADTVTDRCEMRNESDVKRAEYYAKRIKEHFGVEE